MQNVSKQFLLLPTWAMNNFINQLLHWANIDHPTRGKYTSLRKMASTSTSMLEDVSFIFWLALIYTGIVVQI